jgi:hypothetical protein
MAAFVELVQEMRKAQKTYFAYRDQAALEASKALERQVDKELGRIIAGEGVLI